MSLPSETEAFIENQRKMRQEAAVYLGKTIPSIPKVVLELGTGQGDLVERVNKEKVIPYGDIPHFKQSTAPYHAGNLVFGTIDKKPVLIMQGRLHHYEGYSLRDITFPIRVFRELGVKILFVCNGGGSVNPLYRVGELMLITDHINLLWGNPLVGPNDLEMGPKFVDMTEAYNPGLRIIAKKYAANNGIQLHEGVYVANIGPTFETPAESMMAFRIGGDLVGMSTVPEVIVARHMNMQVLGLSQVGNRATGLHQGRLEEAHDDRDMKINEDFANLVLGVLAEILE